MQRNSRMTVAIALVAVLSVDLQAIVPVDTSPVEAVHPRVDGRPSQANTLAALLRLAKSRPPSRPHQIAQGADAHKCMAWLESLRTDSDTPVRVWQAARKAAGLEPLTDEEVRDRLPFMMNFFSTQHGGLVVRATGAQITCEFLSTMHSPSQCCWVLVCCPPRRLPTHT